MKVLIIPWNLYPENAGGAGKSVYYTAQGLAKLPQISAVHILTSTKKNSRIERQGKLLIERYNDLDIKFRTGNKKIGLEDIKRKLEHLKIYKNWKKRIREKYKRFKPDIIHCNDPFSLRQVRKALGYKLDIPIVVSVRGPWPSSSTGTQLNKKGKIIEKWNFFHTLESHGLKAPYAHYKFFKNKKNLKRVDGVQFVSEYMKRKTEEHVKLNSVKKVILTQRPIPKKISSRKKTSKIIAYVGELTYKKGVHKLLEAFKILIDKRKKYKLLIAGVGPQEKEFKKYVKKNKLEDSVTFLGWVDNPNKVYTLATIGVAPSLFPEPLGATSEAMLNGCIPIVSDRGGLPEAVPLKELIVDVENPNILADKIKEIMENPIKQRKIRKTFKDWLKKFSTETAAKQFLSFYEEVIKRFKKKKK